MERDGREIVAVLRGTLLGERNVTPLPVPDTDEVAFAIPCEANEVLAAWSAARAVLDRTRRWPVVVSDGRDTGIDPFGRFPFSHGNNVDTSVAGIIARASHLDGADVFAELAARDDAGDAYELLAAFELPATSDAVGTSPSEEEVRAALGAHPTRTEIDRWLLEWENARGVSSPPFDHLGWFEPEGITTAVVLLPTAAPWEAPAYISFFGAENNGGAERLVAVLRSWYERYGAELVAHFGTMLEFVVARPPMGIDDACELAHEQRLVAPCTIDLPGVTLRQHARSLIDRGTWFLHERP